MLRNRFSRRVLAGWLLIGVVVLGIAAFWLRAVPLRYKSIGSGLHIEFSGSIPAEEQHRLEQESRDALAAVERLFGATLETPCAISFYDQVDWKKAGAISEYSGGYYRREPKYHSVVIPFGAPKETVRHELAHAFVNELGPTKPLINEGIAQLCESDDGFHLHWAGVVIEESPLLLGQERFLHNGEKILHDPLLFEDERARATGWLVVYRFWREGRSLKEIALLPEEELYTRDELLQGMLELEVKYAAVAGLAEYQSCRNGVSLGSYLELRHYLNNPVVQSHFAETRKQFKGYLPRPSAARAIGWLLAAKAAKSGKNPANELAALNTGRYLEVWAELPSALPPFDNAFFRALGVVLVEQHGFDKGKLESLSWLKTDLEARKVLANFGGGQQYSFGTVADYAWALAYAALAGGSSKEDFLASSDELRITGKLRERIEALPRLDATEPPLTPTQEKLNWDERLEQLNRKADYYEKRLELRKRWWHGTE